MKIVKTEIKTHYSIQLTEDEMRKALADSNIITTEQQEDFMKNFKYPLWSGKNQLRTQALAEIARLLGFDGVDNYGVWKAQKSYYSLSVYNWGA